MNHESRAQRLEKALTLHLQPSFLKIVDESELHAGHQGHEAGALETHYRILIVSSQFAGVSRVERQRMINNLLKDEFLNGLHALALKTMTPDEFIAKGRPTEFE